MTDGKELSLAVVEPAISPTEARAAIEKFAAIEKALLDEEDFQEFTAKGEKHRFPKKSAFRKLALAFNLSDDILEERTEEIGDPPIKVWHFTVKATAPNGRYSIGVGSFSTDEREVAHDMHDPRAMAHTRAKNRAISDLIAGGMLSAEEMIGVEEYKAAPPKRTSGPPSSGRALAPTKESPGEAEIKSLRQQLHLKWEELQKADPSVGDKKEWLREQYKVESSIELSLQQIREAVAKVSTMLEERAGPQATTEEKREVVKDLRELGKSDKEIQAFFYESTGKKGGWTKADIDTMLAKIGELKPKAEEAEAEDFLKSLGG